MQSAKQAVKEFLHHGNHHTVDIDQETKPAVVHERVAEQQHENVTTAVDREIHQHHHQIHVQPVQEQVTEEEKHHHNVVGVEHRKHHHGKDAEVERTLADNAAQFRDEREVLPTQTTSSGNTVVGEHVHHHIHDVIQPVVERETIQPHVVHTTVPIHEHIEHEPHIHKGNVLPTMTMDEFTRAGHSLTGHRKDPEHIEYEGEPLAIDGSSHVGFGHQGNTLGNTTGTGNNSGAYTTGTRNTAGGLGNTSTDSNIPRSEQDVAGGPRHNSSLLNKLDPRVDSTQTTDRV